MSFRIVTDTSANLPTPLVKSKNIDVIPFSYFSGDKEYVCTDTETFNGAEFYSKMRLGEHFTTSQINPQKYIDFIEPMLNNGDDVLVLCISSGVSGSFNSLQIAVKELSEKYPERSVFAIDTRGASLGEGIPALKAAEYRDIGMPPEQIAREIQAMCKRMYQVFTVDDLMHLKRSGRVNSATAILGTVLHIKPILKGNELGQIVSFDKIRGRKRAFEMLAAKYDELVKHANSQIVGISHADCEEDAKYLEQLIRKNNPPKEILTVCHEPATGSHVGPGSLALFFEGDEDVRSK